jgi:hypothetical protein
MISGPAFSLAAVERIFAAHGLPDETVRERS